MPITPLNTTDTFRTWYLRTNEIIAALTSGILTAGVSADGVFTIGSNTANRLIVTNALNVSPSNVTINAIAALNANTTFTANIAVTSAAALVNFAPTTFIVQAANSVLLDSPTTVNGIATLTKAVTVNGVFTLANTAAISGNATFGGDVTANTGALITRQLLFKAAGAIAANTVSAAVINDFAPTGLANATILAITPTGATTLTGLLAPTNVTPGGRMLFIQNLSETHTITFKSANTGSIAANQFKTSNNEDVELKPGGLLAAVWSSQTGANHWRLISTGGSAANLLVDATLTGTTNVAGAVGINGVASFAANVAVATNALFVNATNKRVGANTASPSEALEVVGVMKSTTVSTGNVAATGTATLGGLNVASGALFANATHVGVKTATPVAALQVNGDVRVTSFTATASITGQGGASITGGNVDLAGALTLYNADKKALFAGVLDANNTANSWVKRLVTGDLFTGTLSTTGAVSFGSSITAPSVNTTSLTVGGGSTFTGTASFGLANFTSANAAAATIGGALTVNGPAYLNGVGSTIGTLASATQLIIQGTSATENWDVTLFKTNAPWGGIMVQGGTASTGLNVLKVKNDANYQYNIGLGGSSIAYTPYDSSMKNSWFVFDATGNTSIDARALPSSMRLILYPSGKFEVTHGLLANTVSGRNGLVVPVGANKWMTA